MREIWVMQPRFEKRVGNAPFSLVEQPRFRAGFDFLRLRAQTGEADMALAEWWEAFSLAGEGERQDMVDALREQGGRSGRTRSRRKAEPAHTEPASLTKTWACRAKPLPRAAMPPRASAAVAAASPVVQAVRPKRLPAANEWPARRGLN
jgi:poly(A) polymerase